MKVKFISFFDVYQLMLLLIMKRQHDAVYYFDISKPADKLRNILKLHSTARPFVFNMDQVRGHTGESRFVKMVGDDLNGICNEIELQMLIKNVFLKKFRKIFNDDIKVMHFFKKMACREIKDTFVFINVIDWYKNKTNTLAKPVEFDIGDNRFFPVLSEISNTRFGIKLTKSFSLKSIFHRFYYFFGNIAITGVAFFKPFINMLSYLTVSGKTNPKFDTPMIASYYSLHGITFKERLRCDFFWLLRSSIPRERILVYFEREDMPINKKESEILKRNNVHCIAMSRNATATRNVPIYKATLRQSFMLAKLTGSVVLNIVKTITTLRFDSLMHIAEAFYFIREYAKAFDFYYEFNIKINVDSTDFGIQHIPRQLALDALNGVSVSYQRSHMPIPQLLIGSVSDVYFIFGSYYLSNIQNNQNINHTVASCGYITDYTFKAVQEYSKALRSQMEERGAKFILTYFDENSSDDRLSIIPNCKSETIYAQLFELVVNDHTFGLICSPKRPKTLRARIKNISELMDRAVATGRCWFMEGDYTVGTYPSEAAQASDLVFSLLLGGTASLESSLCGKKVIYIDFEGLHSFDEYKNNGDRNIVNTIDAMVDIIDKYRDSVEQDEVTDSHNNLILQQKDPFQDGRAGERISDYISWTFEALSRGEVKRDALKYANKNYGRIWGSDHLFSCH